MDKVVIAKRVRPSPVRWRVVYEMERFIGRVNRDDCDLMLARWLSRYGNETGYYRLGVMGFNGKYKAQSRVSKWVKGE